MSADCCGHDEGRIERDSGQAGILAIYEIRAAGVAGIFLATGVVASLVGARHGALIQRSRRWDTSIQTARHRCSAIRRGIQRESRVKP